MEQKQQMLRKSFDVFLLVGGVLVTAATLAWLEQSSLQNGYTAWNADLALAAGPLFAILGSLSLILRGYAGQHEARRIIATTAFLIALTAGATGVGVFTVMHAQNRDTLENGLTDTLDLTQALIASILERATLRLPAYASEPLYANGLAGPGPRRQEILAPALLRILADGATSVAVEDLQGQVVATAGKPFSRAELALPLAQRKGTKLVWANGRFYLRNKQPIVQHGRMRGYLRLEQALPRVLTSVLLDASRRHSSSMALALCGRDGESVACFPTRFQAAPFRLPAGHGTAALPIARALSGQSGVTLRRNYRGTPVVAAYRPVGNTGLGMVVTINARELYGAPAQKLFMLLPFLIGMIGFGILLVRWRVRPLAAQLLESREELKALIEHVPDGVVTINHRGVIQMFSPAAERMFGWPAAEAVGRNVGMLMPEPERSGHDDHLNRYLAGGGSRIIGIGPREVLAQRKDGTCLATELAVAEIHADGKRCFIGVLRDITARKAVEEEYRLLFTSSLLGAALVSDAGAFLRVNPALLAMLGYGEETLLSLGLLAALAAEDRSRIEGMMGRLLTDTTGGSGETGLLRLLHQTGRTVWVRFALALARDNVRGARWFVLQIEDVTAEREASEALMRSEQRFRAIFGESASSIGVLDREGRILEINAAACKLLGYDADELRAMRAAAVIHPEDREDALALFARVYADGHSARHVLRLQQRNGAIRHAHVAAALMRGDGRDADTLVVMAQDITEMVRVRNALSQQKTFLNAVLETISAGVVACDGQGNLVYFNRAAKALHSAIDLNLPPDAWARGYDLYRPDGATPLAPEEVPLYRALRGEEVCDLEIVIAPRGKPTRRALCSGRKMQAETGEDLGAVIVVHDITALRESEAETRWLVEIIESTSDLVVSMDDDGRIAYINSAGRDILGLDPDQLAGELRIQDFYPDASADRIFKEGIPTALSAGTWQGECMVRDKSGREIPVSQVIIGHREQTEQRPRVSAIMRDISERKKAQERLTWLAYHDPLTTLPNRFLLRDRVEQAIAKARWHERSLALLFLDLDRFKNINDTLGHEVGDQLLKQVAARLGRIVRGDDTVARIGGDEFVILIEDFAHPTDVALVAKKIVDGLTTPFTLETGEFFVTASAGVAVFPSDGDDVRTLLRNADTAMYRAKDKGRNQFHFYRPEMNTHMAERLSLENGLRRALERGEFLLHYQPKVHLATGGITGVEVLLRWAHPERGLVSPLDFIPLLEETGLIEPVSAWVMDAACAQLKRWRKLGFDGLRVAVNLSPRQFAHEGVGEVFMRCFHQHGLEAGAIEAEITESLLMQHPDRAAQVLQEMRAMGVTVAIDDFGTGYSSLAYLSRFPVDTLKIDRAFVRGLPDNRNDAAIARAILEMARALDIKVIAEGVETASQAEFLRAHGCHEMQGWLFSKALPAEEMETLMREGKTLVL